MMMKGILFLRILTMLTRHYKKQSERQQTVSD